MKINSVLICVCLGAITSANNIDTYQRTHSRIFNPDDIIFEIFEMLRWIIKNGSPDVLPVLDPMMFQDKNFQIRLPNKILTINANFTNGVLRGLGDFEVIKVEFTKSDIAVYLSVNFPLLMLTADHYEMEGDIYEAIPLIGYGIFGFQMMNFNISSKIFLKQSENGESAIIDKFQDPQYSIDKITSCTEYDKNIDNIFNALIEDLLAHNLTRFSKFILMKYSDTILETLNSFLEQFETWGFISTFL